MGSVVPHSWNDDRVRILRDGYETGAPVIEIAAQLGVSKNTVIGKAYRLGLKHPTQPTPQKMAADEHDVVRAEHAAGLSYSDIAAARGVTYGTVRRICDPEYRAYLNAHARRYNTTVRGEA